MEHLCYLHAYLLVDSLFEFLGIDNRSNFAVAVGRPIGSGHLDFGLTGVNPVK